MLGDMPGDDLHSFIVRIWLEERATKSSPPRWRGSLIHVLSGRRMYFDRLESLPQLIRPYVESMLAESQLPEGE